MYQENYATIYIVSTLDEVRPDWGKKVTIRNYIHTNVPLEAGFVTNVGGTFFRHHGV